MKKEAMLIRVIVVEDQSTLRNKIRSMVEEEGFDIVAACETVQEALYSISLYQPDLLLLDITLPDGDAFDILEKVPYDHKVIFLTWHEEHAVRAIKFGALDYLLKPISKEDLQTALKKAANSIRQAERIAIAKEAYRHQTQRIVLSDQQSLQVVNLDDIIYCYSDGGYTTFFLADGREIITSKHLKEYNDMLPPQFLRPHKSFLVNENYVESYLKIGYLVLKNKKQIPVSSRRREEIINQLKKHKIVS